MPVSCPNCGSTLVRASRQSTFRDRVRKFFGIYPIVCRICDFRFTESVWLARDLFFARCPRCYRMDLSTWSESYYQAKASFKILMGFGAKRVRCDACRVNFVSFRRVKEPSKAYKSGRYDVELPDNEATDESDPQSRYRPAERTGT
jgi:hypothetical protein